MPANHSAAPEAKGSASTAPTFAPGDIARGTQETGSAAQGTPPSRSIKFAADQSFGDPTHRRDVIRLEKASEEE